MPNWARFAVAMGSTAILSAAWAGAVATGRTAVLFLIAAAVGAFSYSLVERSKVAGRQPLVTGMVTAALLLSLSLLPFLGQGEWSGPVVARVAGRLAAAWIWVCGLFYLFCRIWR